MNDVNNESQEEDSAFLSAISPDNENFSFQTLCDPKEEVSVKKKKNITRLIHGSLKKNKVQLMALNKAGAGIFVTINRTDFRGRSAKNIVRITAVFCDVDDGIERIFSIEPSIIVKTKNGFHYYFLVLGEFPIDMFKPIMQAIIRRYNTDPSVCDLPRVMRLPGFYHMKNIWDPFLIRLLRFNPNIKYTFEQLRAAFPFEEKHDKGLGRAVYKKSQTINSELSNKKKILAGELLGNVFKNCEALRVTANEGKVRQLSHAEGFALLSVVKEFDGGLERFSRAMLGWGKSQSDIYQINSFVKNDYAPYSCQKCQDLGICKKVSSDACMSPINGASPSPIRFATRPINPKKHINEILSKYNEFMEKGDIE